MRQVLFAVAAIVSAAAFSVLALKFFVLPWFWIGLSVFAAAIVVSAVVPRSWGLAVVVVGSLPIAVSLAEVSVAVPPLARRVEVPPLDERDPLLGWRPRRSLMSRATETVNGEKVYDVAYSIDANGHRVSPPDRGVDVEGCVFFFADSFVFGDGVEDRETLPYRVGLKTGGRFRIVNYGYSGYGAEHMLAIVERGELALTAPCRPTNIVYVALPDHLFRTAGKADYSLRGPRYRLNAEGIPTYSGTRPDVDMPAWRKHVVAQLMKSHVYRALVMRQSEVSQQDLDLYFAIVRRAFTLFAEKWPTTRLDVISWDMDFRATDRSTFHKGLESVGVRVHHIDDILAGYSSDPVRFSLHATDPHPTPATYDVVASFLAESVIQSHGIAETSRIGSQYVVKSR
jgi:hypothetical protein